MKTFFTSLAFCAFVASAMAAPEPTAAPKVEKRQSPLDGINISQIVANPSAAIAQISPLLANPTFRSIFDSVTADPGFQSSVQAELVSDYGSQSASAILAEYTSLIASLTASGGAASSSVPGASSTSGTSSRPSTSGAAPTSNTGTTGAGASTGNGAATTYLVTLVGSAITVGAAVVLFV